METMISKYETDQYADTGSVEGQEVKLPDDNARGHRGEISSQTKLKYLLF